MNVFNSNIDSVLRKEPYFHVLFWVWYILFPLIRYGADPYYLAQWGTSNSNILLVIVFAYGSYLYYFPLKAHYKIFKYLSFFAVMSVAGLFFSKWALDLIIYQFDNYSYLINLLGVVGEYIFIGLIFFCLYAFKKNYRLEKAQKIAELKSLRAQISPHFLFNTLNSIYSFALQGHANAPELILKLSDNFKYVLKKGQQSKVTVEDDITQIKDYISIHEMRWGEKIHFNIEEMIDNRTLPISPLLIVTFIENAVKYTSKLKGNNSIYIRYMVKDGQLDFFCQNPYNPDYRLSREWEESGIGIENVKRRLGISYKNRHTLVVNDKNNVFTVHLTMIL